MDVSTLRKKWPPLKGAWRCWIYLGLYFKAPPAPPQEYLSLLEHASRIYTKTSGRERSRTCSSGTGPESINCAPTTPAPVGAFLPDPPSTMSTITTTALQTSYPSEGIPARVNARGYMLILHVIVPSSRNPSPPTSRQPSASTLCPTTPLAPKIHNRRRIRR